MRKATGRSSPDNQSRATSPETGKVDTEMQTWSTDVDDTSHAPQLFTQQVDFVPFDAED